MIKTILGLSFIVVVSLYSKSDDNSSSHYSDPREKIYNENCMICHRQLSFNLKQIYFDYLLKYSSEKAVKLALIDYLKNPNKDTSVMPREYIRRFGLKKPTLLDDKELEMAVDYYWDRYKVFGKLK